MNWGWLLAWTIPWWLYLAASIALAIVALVYIPGKLGTIVVSAIVALGTGWSLYTKGAGEGVDIGRRLERTEWERRANEERARMRREFANNLLVETQRREAAENKNEELRGEVESVYQELERLTDGNLIVVPESLARRLRNLKGRR